MKKKRGDAKNESVEERKTKLSKKRAKDFCEEILLFFTPKTDQKPREKSA